MLVTVCMLTTITLVLLCRFLDVLEKRDYWTLRLRLALIYEYFIIPYSFIVLYYSLQICWILPELFLDHYHVFLQWAASTLACGLGAFYMWRLIESRTYRWLRWKAWTGPSRTGIPAALACYLGDNTDWVALQISLGATAAHPVERFLKIGTPFSRGITSDPTALLKARAESDSESDCLWVPKSDDKAFTYRPTYSEHSVSLLWGECSGFRARCSRGIIAVPRALLTAAPRLKQGVDGRPVCLAHAILARNKGLEPASLVCNLEKTSSFRVFEENSLFWPRPSKTLRGFYREEFSSTFSLMGHSYVTAATELALLLADVPAALIEDWLDGCMEHQDLDLNREAAAKGASAQDLARLYRGQYAAMLVSLSLHRRGLRMRPELLVYDAICGLDNAERSAWTDAPWAVRRRKRELEQCGSTVMALIGAII